MMTELDEIYPGYGFASHKGYATEAHESAIRELGPSPVHRRSFDYIREVCGEYCDVYYDLKARGERITSRDEMISWEVELEAGAQRLSDMEMKKLRLMKGRVWRRIAG